MQRKYDVLKRKQEEHYEQQVKNKLTEDIVRKQQEDKQKV